MAKTDTTLTVAQIAATVQTVGQGRAVLGRCAELLQQGYARLSEIPSDVRDDARDVLDLSNAYATGIYAMLSTAPADQGEPLPVTLAGRVGAAMETSRKALRVVEDSADATYWDFAAAMKQVLGAVGGVAGDGLQAITNSVASGAAAFVGAAWPTLLLLLVVLVVAWKSGALRAVVRV